MILAIVGTRERLLRSEVLARLMCLQSEIEDGERKYDAIATGCCPTGVDELVRRAYADVLPVVVCRAPWGKGQWAGPARNVIIARISDLCLALPEKDETMLGSGTWHCIRQFERLGKPVEIFGDWKRPCVDRRRT